MDLQFLNDNEGLRAEIQLIKQNILIILDEVHHNRYYINKHFQNCMINYFLRNINFPILRQVEPGYTCSKTMNNTILQKYINLEGANYLKLMKGYLQEIINQGKLQLYRETLVQMTMQDIPCSKFYKGEQKQMAVVDLKSNKEYQSEIWKKAFSLFVLFHSYNQNIKGIFEIWNSLFPQDQIKRKRKQNINHIIVIPTRNNQPIETKTEVVSPVKDQESEEQEIVKQNIQFYQQASQGFQFFGLYDDNLTNKNNNNPSHNNQEEYPINNECYYSSQEENLYFSYPTMCSTHNFFSNISGDCPLLSSESQDIKVMYEDQIIASPQNDQNQSSGEYDEFQSELPYHSKKVEEAHESKNVKIQVNKIPISKGKRKRCAVKETSTFDPHSLGKKLIKKQEQNNFNRKNLPSYLMECSLPYQKEATSLESINLTTFSSSDLTNQGSKKEFTTC